MDRTLEIIGVQMDMGASRRGVSMGPQAIRLGGLQEGLERLGYTVEDRGDILPPPPGASFPNLRNRDQVVEGSRRLFSAVGESLAAGHFPIVLGGDHSIAAGSVSAAARHFAPRPLGLIWIDAHGDWNSDETTLTGNMHGMSFSAVCGYGPRCMVDFGGEPVFVPVEKCVQIGGRDIDPRERRRMKEAGVTVFSIHDIDRMGMDAVMRRALDIAGSGTAGIHLSFDVDAITPESAPGTGTVVHSGLTVREAFLALELLAESETLVSMDMVEVNPILDVRNKTGILASELIQSALGKSVY